MAPRAGAPRFDFADIVRQHRVALEQSVRLSAAQCRVLTDIARCRTAALGGHLDACPTCGYEHPAYNSCRNRHCPKCQALSQQKWIERQSQRLLDVPHFHVVFTMPAELRSLTAFAPTVMFGLLFSCATATLQSFARRRLNASLGITMVLHTWDKQLGFHPHVHSIVTAGGLRPDGAWTSSQQQFLFPVIAMARVQRGKMQTALRSAYREGAFKEFDDFEDPQAFDQLMRTISKKNWYVYAKRSFDRAKYVVEYLGRYTHRIALSNSRLLAVTNDRVVIRTRGNGRAAMTNVELLRRFVRHVLPKGFHKIRHFGLYAHPTCTPSILTEIAPTYAEHLRRLTGRDILRCPHCASPLELRPIPIARAPPMQAA